jgi:hypothetical protein
MERDRGSNDANHQIIPLETAGRVSFQDAAERLVTKYEARPSGWWPTVFPFDNLDVGTANPNRDGFYEYRTLANIRLFDLFPLGSARFFRFDRDRPHTFNLVRRLLSRQLRCVLTQRDCYFLGWPFLKSGLTGSRSC